MSTSSTRLLPAVLASAVLGGGLAVGAVSLFDLGATTKTTTVVQQAPMSAKETSSTEPGLTPRDIYKRDSPSVAFIRAEVVQHSQSDNPFDFGMPTEQRGESTGSGFVVDGDGDILTNAHVVADAVKVTVQFADKKVVDAKIIGRDTSSDLALLKVDPDGLNLKALALGTSKNVQVGDPVLAIGNPFGLDRTLTTGVVSALQRQIQAPNNFTIDNVIQTDAAINPGNSGGPLIDATGRVIGINSQIETGGSGNGNVGIGFAIPIDTAKQILPQLKKNGTVQRAYLGISSLTIDGSLRALNLPVDNGVLVQSVQRGSPADKAGLRAGSLTAQLESGTPVQIGGDIIQSVDGKPIATAEDLQTAIGNKQPGSTVKLGIIRGRDKKTLEVKLASRPNAPVSQG